MLKMKHVAVLCALLLIGALTGPVMAQGYPTKTVRIVVPYTPGGPADLLARGLAQKLSDEWGQPVIVDNRPGANEIIAAELVAKAPPDGYTFLLASDAVFSLNTYLYSKLPYDAVKNFAPVSKLVLANLMLVTRPDFPGKTVQDLIAQAKQNPGKLTYGSVGAGGVNHLAMAWVTTVKGLQMEHIPYKGLVQALQDIAAGRVDTMYAVIGGARPLIAAGQIRGIAVSGKTRSPILPDVPTFAEAGEPDLDASFYFGVAAPSGTPNEAIQKFASAAGRIVNAPEFTEKYLVNLGFQPVGDTPEQFAAFLVTDRKAAADKVKASGAKLD
ncbi:MAG TPA: tripartite tricarboxylate transporter substrate binding protein [Beijerinckiaceae bacterium]|nr:tripartite tricarboxylate transporter substrate binding protein [Beijerinckiaceae bacterium]